MNMETCTEHDDAVVVYDGWGNVRRFCPFCTLKEESERKIDKLEDENSSLDSKVDALEYELENARTERDSFKAEADELRAGEDM